MRVNIRPHPTADGWYYLEYRPHGYKGKRERIKVEGYDAACSYRDRLEARFNSPQKRIEVHPRFKDVYKQYLSWVEENQAPATYETKRRIFENTLIPHFGEHRVRDLSQRTFDEFRAKLKCGRRGVILYQACLSGMITWMVKRSMAVKLDFRPEMPVYNRPKRIIPHPSDLDAIINAIEDEARRVLCQLMLVTGLRWNEARNIEWKNVDLKAGQIRLTESEQEDNDLIVIPDNLKEWFKTNRKLGGWVFPNPATGKPYVNIKRCLNRACKKVGVRITPHMLRHASATYLYEATGDIYAVQFHLRHKNLNNTQIYTHYSTARKIAGQRALVAHLDKLRGETKEKTQTKRRSSCKD